MVTYMNSLPSVFLIFAQLLALASWASPFCAPWAGKRFLFSPAMSRFLQCSYYVTNTCHVGVFAVQLLCYEVLRAPWICSSGLHRQSSSEFNLDPWPIRKLRHCAGICGKTRAGCGSALTRHFSKCTGLATQFRLCSSSSMS